MEFDGHRFLLGEGPGREDLAGVVVGRDDAGTAAGEADRRVAGATPDVEHTLPSYLAEDAPVDVVADAGPELDMVERSAGRGARVVARHQDPRLPKRWCMPVSLAALTGPSGDGYSHRVPTRSKLGLQDAAASGGVDYRLAREATLSAWREGSLTRAQICDGQRELQRNAEFCGAPTGRPCPVCEAESLVEVTYVFGPRLPKGGRCVTSDRELDRLAARKSVSQGYVVEVCTGCRWNHLTESRSIGGS